MHQATDLEQQAVNANGEAPIDRSSLWHQGHLRATVMNRQTSHQDKSRMESLLILKQGRLNQPHWAQTEHYECLYQGSS